MSDAWKFVTPDTWSNIAPEVIDGVGLLRMNRPSKRNALSAEICVEMTQQLELWAKNPDVAVIVFYGTEDFFSAGMDLEEYLAQDDVDRYEHMEAFHRFYRGLVDYDKPTIAAVAGPAFAGACDLLAHCDIRVVTRSAQIGMPQPKYGIHSHFSPLWRLTGLGYAKMMFFTGDMIDGEEAFRVGLADKLVEDGEAYNEAMALAGRMAALGSTIQRRLKEIAKRAPTMEPISAVAYETAMYREVTQTAMAQQTVASGFSKVQANGHKASLATATKL